MTAKIRSLLVLLGMLALLLHSSSMVLADGEVVDQQQESYTQWSTLDHILPVGQEFVPTMSSLIAVEVLIDRINPHFGDDTITLRIRESTIGGTILGTESRLVDPVFWEEGWLRFDFPSTITLTPGSTYVIELQVEKATFAWAESYLNPYPHGRGIKLGAVLPEYEEWDWTFRTYAAEPSSGTPVGGTAYPMNTLTLLAPWIALSIVIAAGGIYLIRRRVGIPL